MNFKNKFFLKSVPIIFSSGIYLYSKSSIQLKNSEKECHLRNHKIDMGFLSKFFDLRDKVLSKKIMYCRRQEKNELDYISEYDIEITDNYLKKIEEK